MSIAAPRWIRRNSPAQCLSALLTDVAGASIITFGLILPILIAALGLAIDVGMWQLEQRRIQSAADNAAYAAALAAAAGATSNDATTEATAFLATLGYIDGSNGITARISNPATTGNHSADPDSWEVHLTSAQPLYFASFFLADEPRIAARAVALGGSSDPSPFCILTLDSSGSGATTFTNNAVVPNANCNIYTNSSHLAALSCDNNCDIAGNTYTVGGNRVTNNGSLSGEVNQTGVSAAVDPYRDLPVPDPSTLACTRTTILNVSSNQTILPGVYCGGINVISNKTLTMSAGTYYVKTKFNMAGNSVLQATGGVTIVLLNDVCLGSGECRREKGIGNNVTINLTAPTTGDYAGIALLTQGTRNTYQEFSNNVHLNIEGTIYAPGDSFYFHNNADFNSSLCAQLVAFRVNFENNASMGTNCETTGVRNIENGDSSQQARLVE